MKRWLAVVTLTTCGLAGALNLSGAAGPDLPDNARVGVFLVGASGAAVSEFASTPIQNGRFSLAVPDAAPATSAQFPLRRENIAWPGVLEPVKLSQEVSAGELRAYIYADSNGNGHFDSGEAQFETPLRSGRDAVVLVWVNGDTRVEAARGFDANLKRGWNALSISTGKTAKVAPYADGALTLTLVR